MGVLNLLKRAASSVTTPDPGRVKLFIDSTTGLPSIKDETGAASSLVGTPSSRNLTAGAGLTGGGTLAADRTFDVGATDTTITVAADGIKANTGVAAGTVAAGNDSRITGAVQGTRSITAGTGLSGGGDLTADRTLTNADRGSTAVATHEAAGDPHPQYLTPAEGNAAYSTLAHSHSNATTSTAGFMAAADKAYVENAKFGFVNVLDFGADRTGAVSCETAVNNAITALGASGGVVYFPAGVYLTTSSPFTITANQIILRGVGPGQTFLKTASTTGDQLRVTGYGSCVEDMNIQGPGTGTTSNKTAGLGLSFESTEGQVRNVEFAYQYEALSLAGHLVDAHGLVVRYFNRTGIIVNHNSDHRITEVLMVNNAATLPTLAGIDVRVTASLVLEQLNIIACNFALNISPAGGVTVPSVKATDCFFDTSVVGLNMQGAGSVFRSEFTNCWFSSMTVAGVRMNPTQANGVNGITFVNCDFYNNVGGTTGTGIDTNTNVGKWKMVGCTVAQWQTGINLIGGTNHFPTIIGNTIGAASAFTGNITGIAINAGAFRGFMIQGNDVVDNTGAISLGAFTATDYKMCRIVDNAGINPKGAVTPPITTPVSATTYTNTTGFRCFVTARFTTTFTALAINGVAHGATAANAAVGITLDPGSTIAMTGTGTASWAWSAM